MLQLVLWQSMGTMYDVTVILEGHVRLYTVVSGCFHRVTTALPALHIMKTSWISKG